MENLTYVWVQRDKPIAKLKKLLESWTDKSLDYCRWHDWEDCGWFYGERASLSILAGAAWCLQGWCAMEEYSSDKHKPTDKAAKSRKGRADLWIGNSRTGYAIEAKQSWQSIGRRAPEGNSDVKAKLESAWKDAGCLPADCADHRIAAVFVVPRIPVSEVSTSASGGKGRVDRKMVREVVERWLGSLELKSQKRIHAYAWVFPGNCEEYVSESKRYIFPGTLLLLGERQRRNRY